PIEADNPSWMDNLSAKAVETPQVVNDTTSEATGTARRLCGGANVPNLERPYGGGPRAPRAFPRKRPTPRTPSPPPLPPPHSPRPGEGDLAEALLPFFSSPVPQVTSTRFTMRSNRSPAR